LSKSGGRIVGKKRLLAIMIGNKNNVKYNDFVRLIESFGFRFHRSSGSHNVYKHPKVGEILNIQNDNGKAKPYQIDQFLKYVEYYGLERED
jgi:predicted RNA binding protein YcfA (HicA-like mRNA interferase family)